MKIDFNNVRKQAAFAYGRLVEKLEEARDNNHIEISADQIQEDINDLRNAIGAICYTYEPDNDDFRDLADEIGEMPVFNREEVEA